MVPTFQNNDYLIVEKISLDLNPPKRGDVVIFRSPEQPAAICGFPDCAQPKDLIKRVIGLPGEKVEIINADVFITDPSGKRFQLNEPYIVNQQIAPQNIVKQLGADEIFVLGDNRPVVTIRAIGAFFLKRISSANRFSVCIDLER